MSRFKVYGIHLFLIIASFLSLFPFIWMIIGTTNTSTEILKGKITLGNALIENIENLFNMADLTSALGNSLIIAVIGTIGTLFISSMAGYAFEIYKSKNKEKIFHMIILGITMPFAAIMIPLFRIFADIGLLNTLVAVIVPYLATPYIIFFFRQNTRGFSVELLQAARVDGLNEWRCFLQIYMPTMKATYSAAAIITFMNYWNAFLWPLVALQTPDKKTLPLVISSLASAYNPDYGVIMVAIVLSTLPTLLIFFLMQKYFVEGMVGSIK